MANEGLHRLQDTFLEHLQRKKTRVTMFLVNGVKLQGVIVGFDAFCVMLERDGQQQIVYKHSITAASPAYSVDLRDTSEGPSAPPPMSSHSPRPRGTFVVERVSRPRFPR